MSAERHEFQAETRQLLQLMIHSLYANREVFLRELISNASDALDKRRFSALSDASLLQEGDPPTIDLQVDEAAGTLSVRDPGIGMTREEVVSNLGTIAHSGTRKFLESLNGDEQKQQQLIGQFGVGFYSAFVVADRVEVLTRAGGAERGVRWISDGEGSYSVEDAEKADVGTEVTLHLREDDRGFLQTATLQDLVQRYSDHISWPIRLLSGSEEPQTLNRASAFWTRPKNELKDEDYQQFYRHLTHDPLPPLGWAHHRVEGNLEYTSLLYVPAEAPPDVWDRQRRRGLSLYVKRVFVVDAAETLMPAYLRFVRGIVDSADLPLNVSREVLQNNQLVDKIRTALVRRVLDLLENLAKDRPDDYQRFWTAFGQVLKEGLVEDFANRERIAKLCRFRSTQETEQAKVSLEDYVARMPADQTGIYYLTADHPNVARSSPHLEGYSSRGYEVLFLTDPVDEWWVLQFPEFAGKALISVSRGAAEFESKVETPDQARDEVAFNDILLRLTQQLTGKISAARLSKRLTESPACLVLSEQGMSRRLDDLLRHSGRVSGPTAHPVLELNSKHPLVDRLQKAGEGEFGDLAELLYGQALLAEGGQLEDPAGFVKRLNRILLGESSRPSIILT